MERYGKGCLPAPRGGRRESSPWPHRESELQAALPARRVSAEGRLRGTATSCMSTNTEDEPSSSSVEDRAPHIRSLTWLRPTGLGYSNPDLLSRARKRRHARLPTEYGSSSKRASYTARSGVGSSSASHHSPPRQHVNSKHARGSPKVAGPMTTDRRQRAAAAAFILGTPCENCGNAMQRCFGSGRFCGQTCASKFSRVGRAVSSPQSDAGSTENAGIDSATGPLRRPCEACSGAIFTVFGSGRFCKKACAARFSRIGSKNRTKYDGMAVSAPEPGALSPAESKAAHVLQDHAEMQVEEEHSQSKTVSLGADVAITVSASGQLTPTEA